MKTILITGSSSGIGQAAALYFQQKHWQVIATMRNPEKRKTALHGLEGIDLQHLDVADTASIRAVMQYAVKKYGQIDVLVNNAGYSLTGLFENSTPEQVLQQYQTNVFGLMAVTREVLPVFRQQKNGVLINVASIAGRMAFPLYSLYNSTKWAVEGFSEALSYELRALNVKMKIIEPGIIHTDFYERSMVVPTQKHLEDYGEWPKRILAGIEATGKRGSHPRVIAKLIYRAATDGTWKLRYAAGQYARLILTLRRILPFWLFRLLLKSAM